MGIMGMIRVMMMRPMIVLLIAQVNGVVLL
jgi:hypothetical protein